MCVQSLILPGADLMLGEPRLSGVGAGLGDLLELTTVPGEPGLCVDAGLGDLG